jgi:hypothetical protein
MSAAKGAIRITLLCLTVWAHPALGQSRDRGPIVLDLSASTRALALGNAFALGSGDSDALFYHPGQLSRAQGFVASLQRFTAMGTFTALSAGQSWFGGGVALGVQHLGYQIPQDAIGTVEDILDLPGDEASLRDGGELAASELVLSAGYGRRLMGAQMGVVGKLVEQRLGFRKAGTVAVDLGIVHSEGPVTMGLAAQNLGPAMDMAGGEVPLPVRFTLGASSRSAPLGPLDVSASGALSYRLDGDLAPSLGLEVGYWPLTGRTFVGRIGYRHRTEEFTTSPITFGGAFMGDNIVLEYAYQGYETGSASHSFSIGWR